MVASDTKMQTRKKPYIILSMPRFHVPSINEIVFSECSIFTEAMDEWNIHTYNKYYSTRNLIMRTHINTMKTLDEMYAIIRLWHAVHECNAIKFGEIECSNCGNGKPEFEILVR